METENQSEESGKKRNCIFFDCFEKGREGGFMGMTFTTMRKENTEGTKVQKGLHLVEDIVGPMEKCHVAASSKNV